MKSCLITLSAYQLKLTITSIEKAKNDYSVLKSFLCEYVIKYGEDAYCRIGKSIFAETIRKTFAENSFRLLCALSSALRKKSLYKRITKDVLSIRMLGYKTKQVLISENCKTNPMSRGQMSRLIDQLNSRGFFSKFTYSSRITFYSTKLNYEDLVNCIIKSKTNYDSILRNKTDKEYSLLIKSKIETIKKKKEVKACTSRAQIHALVVH